MISRKGFLTMQGWLAKNDMPKRGKIQKIQKRKIVV